MGKIGLKGVKIYGHVGVTEEERIIGRNFLIDIEVEYPLEKAGADDKIEDTLNYESLLIIVEAKMHHPYHLLEAAAKSIADEVIILYPEIISIRIRIEKLRPFMKGEMHSAYIEWVQ